MFLKKLTLQNFRNYSHWQIEPCFKTLLIGNNGQGKTNILEALYLLSSGSSFRASTPESFIFKNEQTALISAQVVVDDVWRVLDLVLEKQGKKNYFIDHSKNNRVDLGALFPVLVFSPEMMVLLKGSAEERRKWIDRHLKMSGYATNLAEFNKILAHKNQILKAIKSSDNKKKLHFFSLLESVNELFLEKNLQFVTLRKKILVELKDFFKNSSERIFGYSNVNVDIQYKVAGLEPFEEIEALAAKIKKTGMEKECFSGLSLYGAHRDDISIFFQGKNSRFFCSQGQQRALILALKLAQALWFCHVKKKACLLLLDDIFSEIDKHLIKNLLEFLEETSSQIILTSVSAPSFFNSKKFQVFDLRKGV